MYKSNSNDPSMLGFDNLLNMDENDGIINLDELKRSVLDADSKKNAPMAFESELKHLTEVQPTGKNLTELKYPSDQISKKDKQFSRLFSRDDDDDIKFDTGDKNDSDDDNNENESDEDINQFRKPLKKTSFARDYDDELRTEEQRKSFVAQRALNDIKRTGDFDLQKESEEEEKIHLLAEIDMLLDILKEEEISVVNIKIPDKQSSLQDIVKAHHILRLKNDHNRSRVLADETLLAAANVLEHVFDGKRVIFGRRPDLTGWSSTVNVKLRRMRFDTSSFVNNIMRKNNFGPGMRLALELIPSMFLHSKLRKKNYGDDLYTSNEMNQAYGAIRDVEEKK